MVWIVPVSMQQLGVGVGVPCCGPAGGATLAAACSPSGGKEAAQGWITHGPRTLAIRMEFHRISHGSLARKFRDSPGLVLLGLQGAAVFGQVDGANRSESLKAGEQAEKEEHERGGIRQRLR